MKLRSALLAALLIASNLLYAAPAKTISIKVNGNDADESSVLLPGTKIVAGDLTQNEFFILDKDEQPPIRLASNDQRQAPPPHQVNKTRSKPTPDTPAMIALNKKTMVEDGILKIRMIPKQPKTARQNAMSAKVALALKQTAKKNQHSTFNRTTLKSKNSVASQKILASVKKVSSKKPHAAVLRSNKTINTIPKIKTALKQTLHPAPSHQPKQSKLALNKKTAKNTAVVKNNKSSLKSTAVVKNNKNSLKTAAVVKNNKNSLKTAAVVKNNKNSLKTTAMVKNNKNSLKTAAVVKNNKRSLKSAVVVKNESRVKNIALHKNKKIPHTTAKASTPAFRKALTKKHQVSTAQPQKLRALKEPKKPYMGLRVKPLKPQAPKKVLAQNKKPKKIGLALSQPHAHQINQ